MAVWPDESKENTIIKPHVKFTLVIFFMSVSYNIRTKVLIYFSVLLAFQINNFMVRQRYWYS